MAFKSDGYGIAFKSNDIKIQTNGHTWGMKLSQIYRQPGQIRIITYSLPDIEYVANLFSKRPTGIFMIAHAKFENKARRILDTFNEIKIALNSTVHSKILLIHPNTVVITSANFGDSHWHETSISIHSSIAHDWYVENAFTPLWDKSDIL
jgi:hypothetical protein